MSTFIIRIFKSWGVRDPERRWVNTYEVTTTSSSTPPAQEDTMMAFVEAEREIHHHKVQFLSATISTWVEDSRPYDPGSFNTYELSTVGKRDTPDAHALEALDLNVIYLIKRQTVSGRSGKLFYRGCVLELDVEMAGDGRFQISTGAAIAEAGTAFSAYQTAMAPFLDDGGGASKLALISKIAGSLTIRPVTELHVGNIGVNRRNHRYFNRAAAALRAQLAQLQGNPPSV